ncbi:hypothetical protein EV699_113116 [Plasticicumulans lactativorans]|uniref:Uncharacterized protein n=1 Tax=Plasticicumulans lactativorans TaxID=1133106 RepID=A0A4R2LCR4_9GAMM|nr:hypothetical protein EV699_113116 [Plasticicumulans lactativorans]
MSRAVVTGHTGSGRRPLPSGDRFETGVPGRA